MRKILVSMAMLTGMAVPAWAASATITLPDKNVFPESMTAMPDNTVIVGSMLQPYIYRARPGATVAERWIDLTSVGSTSWGVLADVKSNTLWTCTVAHPLTDTMTPPIKERHSALRAFDLKSGKPKASYTLLGDTNACNDITVAPNGTVYVSDLANGQIQRLKKGAEALDVWSKTDESANIDGITFLGNVLYFSNVQTGHIYRLPIGKDGAAGAAVDIALPQPLGGPDGVRAWKGKLYVAENRTNQVSELTITGDSATVKVLKTGFQTATGVAPTRDTVWVEESKQNYWRAPLQGSDPNPFIIQPVPLPK